MSMARRIERLERHEAAAPVAPVELVETDGDEDAAGQARVRAALARADAVAGPWEPGQPVRVIELVRPPECRGEVGCR